MFQWLTRWIDRVHVEPEDASADLAEARQDTKEAQRKLEQTQLASQQVRSVSDHARRLRSDNHFSARMKEVFGSHG